MVLYRCHIPQLDDLLDQLRGAMVFAKLDMKIIIKFESVLVMNGKQCLNAHGVVSMVGDAVRVVKCPKYIHEVMNRSFPHSYEGVSWLILMIF